MNDETDETLWEVFTADIRPIKRDICDPRAGSKPPKKQGRYNSKPLKNNDIQYHSKLGTVKKDISPPQLDRRTDERLKKGKMPLEARLDLHGMTQDEAIIKLSQFIKASYSQGFRTILVITGKGSLRKPGILRQNVPEWLTRDEYDGIVLKTVSAQPKDGGTGAYYVYLKRRAFNV